MKKYIEKAAVLIEALPYIQSFRNSIVVVKFGGSVIENAELTEQALRDIVFMECIGIKPVIVHGGGKAITSKLEGENIPTYFINGLRFTCDKAIKIVDDVLHNRINVHFVNILNKLGGNAKKLSGKEILKAKKMYSTDKITGEKLDLGYVGNVYDVNIDKIVSLTDADTIPVITPLGIGSNNQIFNVNADIAASIIAEHLQARKLVFVSDVPGVLKDPDNEDSVISSIKLNEIEKYIANGIITGGMIPKVRSAMQALNAGTNKVHFIDGRIEHSLLLEIFTNSGIGTQILKENSPLNTPVKNSFPNFSTSP
jgi:acetylglutamate kinase